MIAARYQPDRGRSGAAPTVPGVKRKRLGTMLRWLFVALLALAVGYLALGGKGCVGQRVSADCYVR